jgi:Gpi18-like mannosyltransferase
MKVIMDLKDRLGCLLQRIKDCPFHFGLSIILAIVILLIITRIVAFAYLFNLEYIEPYGKLTPDAWWLVFHRWDSAFYDRIASSGYVELRDWAFLPAFPGAIKALNFLVGNSSVSTALTGLIFGVLWVPIYHKVASIYVGEKSAAYSTLLFAFFPTVYLFTSLGYTEGLWLTCSLLGIYFYLKERHALSGGILALSALTRIPGIILPLIFFLHKLVQKRIKQALFYLLPLVALIAWLGYGFLQTGSPFAPITAQTSTVWNPHLNFVEVFLIPLMTGNTLYSWNEYSVFFFIALAVFSYFCIKVFSVDKVLGIYSISLLAFFLTTGYFLSYSRYIPFIFPMWLSLKVKNRAMIVVYVIIGYILALILWSQFLNDRWVG